LYFLFGGVGVGGVEKICLYYIVTLLQRPSLGLGVLEYTAIEEKEERERVQ
jgi:hypothetical protein